MRERLKTLAAFGASLCAAAAFLALALTLCALMG